MDGRHGCHARPGAAVAPVTAASASSGDKAQALPTAATEATIREARAELERAVTKAGLTNDPIRYLLEATSSALGAFLVGIEAMRRPMDAELREALTATHADVLRREGRRLLVSGVRRDAFLAGLAVAVLIVATGVGCYAWGRAAEATRSREIAGALATALRDGSASGQRWLDLIQGNDILAALQQCDGNNARKDAAGRRACAVPLWIDLPNASGAPPVLSGRRP